MFLKLQSILSFNKKNFTEETKFKSNFLACLSFGLKRLFWQFENNRFPMKFLFHFNKFFFDRLFLNKDTSSHFLF